MQKRGSCRLALLIGLLLATGFQAGCSSDGNVSGSPSSGTSEVGSEPGIDQSFVTAIPTAPRNLPPLEGVSGGSEGYRVSASPGMVLPLAVVSPVPQMTGGTVINREAAIRLGKALFWDTQTGSDGQMACASCHFMAGTDSRAVNTVYPGHNAAFEIITAPGTTFPFFTFDAAWSDDIVGSSGVVSRLFAGISKNLADPVDICTPLLPTDPSQALLHNAGQRQVTGRNTPSVIGAVFYLDNFWDGRASHNFNGLTPLGTGKILAKNASLASQSVGPPLSDVEMSCAARPFNGPDSLGAKLVPRIPLAGQLVNPTDSVLGALSNAPGNGLDCGFPDRPCTYADLIAAAFGTYGLSGENAVKYYIDNFSSIWGQAVQAYEATLVANRTPYDLGTLTAAQVNGLQSMRRRGCMVCHVEPEFSDATVRTITERGGPAIPKTPGGDQGFHNIGASPTADDLGRAASPGGTYHNSIYNRGAFKTPDLRNVALTAPYMHNGSIATLQDVLEFYNGTNMMEGNEGFNPASKVGLGGDRDDAADFMLNGLTDCRVKHSLAPFDHPSLVIPNGPMLPAYGKTGDGTICP